jgi:hypothetical protein
MTPPAPYDIRRIFLTPRPNLPLMSAAERLGMTLQELKRDIADGAIVAVSTRVGTRVTKEEMIATAMRLWDQSVIEEALGDDAPRLIPEAIRRAAGARSAISARCPSRTGPSRRHLCRRHPHPRAGGCSLGARGGVGVRAARSRRRAGMARRDGLAQTCRRRRT